MKPSYFIFLSLLSLLSCQSNLEVISAKRKTIYPGIQTQKPYVKFIVVLETPKTISIDSARVIENNTCFKLDRIHSVTEKSTFQKKYTVEILFKGNEATIGNCGTLNNGMLSLYYTTSNTQKVIEISSFTSQTETKR